MRPLAAVLCGVMRTLVGAHARWQEPPSSAPSIYFANHTSHMDTLAIWAALGPRLRAHTRPVAARDYWDRGALRRHVARRVLNVVFVERHREGHEGDPLAPLAAALQEGSSLILFPEGTRGTGPLPGAFRSGLYNLAARFPQVRLVPVYLENMHRSMPKGTFVPIPVICTVRFGAPLARIAAETREAFLERARAAVVALA
ncbi:MAG TPA: lysophospholipid acyltransferase family protein [Steroidobacteraceae bacterium]|nr:lysophospholipid acyltransferase family protein [Steroidobacteraceae bacterium]